LDVDRRLPSSFAEDPFAPERQHRIAGSIVGRVAPNGIELFVKTRSRRRPGGSEQLAGTLPHGELVKPTVADTEWIDSRIGHRSDSWPSPAPILHDWADENLD
jgi:hypothetical protein